MDFFKCSDFNVQIGLKDDCFNSSANPLASAGNKQAASILSLCTVLDLTHLPDVEYLLGDTPHEFPMLLHGCWVYREYKAMRALYLGHFLGFYFQGTTLRNEVMFLWNQE